MTGLRLYKKEKICSPTDIDLLFAKNGCNSSALDYPLRAVWRHNTRRFSDAPIAFVISVPKKRLKHAVDRVAMRRRIREAFRLARPRFPLPSDVRIDVAFIFVADNTRSFGSIARAVEALLAKISEAALAEQTMTSNSPTR